MPSLKDIIHSKDAMQEWGITARAIQPFMTDAASSRKEKREILNEAVKVLSDSTFKNGIVVDQIISIINMKEDVCKEYPNTEAQVNGILSWLPRMSEHRERLTKAVTRARKAAKVKE